MSAATVRRSNSRISMFDRLISSTERVGNLLPHPFTLFLILILAVFVLSFILSRAGVSVSYVSIDGETAEPVAQLVPVVNLAEKTMLQGMMENFVKTFAYFTPVGFVIIMVLGVSIAEQTGFFSAVIRTIVLRTPPALITFVIALVGICANVASDAGIIVAPTLGGAIFLALGRHPIAGVCAGYVAAYGGYSANLFITGTDVVLAGITESAASHFAIDAPIHPLMNWYAMIGSTVVLAVVVTFITERAIVPHLGKYNPPKEAVAQPFSEFQLGAHERRGLLAAGIATVLFFVVVLLLTVPADAVLRNAEGKLLPRSPLISGIIFIIFMYFFIVGIVYGAAAGTLRSEKEVPKMMERGLVGVASFLVVCLPASIFIDLFNKSNLTTLIAVNGADLIKGFDIGAVPTLLLFVLFCAVVNIFITSGFTQWLVLAPIFVPLLFQLGASPAITQMAFRIGDSTTNLISPISAYLPFLLGLLEKYRNAGQEIGIGSAISLMLPYSLLLLLVWTVFLAAWLLLGLDPGPGVSLFVS